MAGQRAEEAERERAGQEPLSEQRCVLCEKVGEIEKRLLALAAELEKLGATVSIEVHVGPMPAAAMGSETGACGRQTETGRASRSAGCRASTVCPGADIELVQEMGHGWVETRTALAGMCSRQGGCDCPATEP